MSSVEPAIKPRGKRTLDCPCGQRIRAESEDELVVKAQEHLKDRHPGMNYSRDEILFIAF